MHGYNIICQVNNKRIGIVLVLCIIVMQLLHVNVYTVKATDAMLAGLGVAVLEGCVQEGRCGLMPGFLTEVWINMILPSELH